MNCKDPGLGYRRGRTATKHPICLADDIDIVLVAELSK